MEKGTAIRRLYQDILCFHWPYSHVLAGSPVQVTALVAGAPETMRVVRHWNGEVVDATLFEVLKSRLDGSLNNLI